MHVQDGYDSQVCNRKMEKTSPSLEDMILHVYVYTLESIYVCVYIYICVCVCVFYVYTYVHTEIYISAFV
jgi:hypothetical protein